MSAEDKLRAETIATLRIGSRARSADRCRSTRSTYQKPARPHRQRPPISPSQKANLGDRLTLTVIRRDDDEIVDADRGDQPILGAQVAIRRVLGDDIGPSKRFGSKSPNHSLASP
jgi:hypothetical protein